MGEFYYDLQYEADDGHTRSIETHTSENFFFLQSNDRSLLIDSSRRDGWNNSNVYCTTIPTNYKLISTAVTIGDTIMT